MGGETSESVLDMKLPQTSHTSITCHTGSIHYSAGVQVKIVTVHQAGLGRPHWPSRGERTLRKYKDTAFLHNTVPANEQVRPHSPPPTPTLTPTPQSLAKGGQAGSLRCSF